MDEINKEIINMIQKDFPIHNRPYSIIGAEMGISEEEVINRITDMKEAGLIRRMGGIFDSRKLGYYSTLCAAKVPEDKIEEVAEAINSVHGVTHNYLREHSYNMWFTLIVSSKEKSERVLQELRESTAAESIISLPSEKLFKISVNFDLNEV
ncbi:DNA-binding Lrp family transcriptional regulator [Desulfitispora alkaliphila]|uniref:siroheme decarboxylase subunit alpha n=1 Tax=Desulfitispora alkaliphila TaxID=622674 RepID=UPI003D219730